MKFINSIAILVSLFEIQYSFGKSVPNDFATDLLTAENGITDTFSNDYLMKNVTYSDSPIKEKRAEAQTVAPKINLNPVDFTLIENKKVTASLYIDQKDSEYDGISIIAEALKSDIARVIGESVDKEGKASNSANGLKIITNKAQLSGKTIIAGTFGAKGNDVINQLIDNGKIDVSNLKGRWERYQMQVIKNPMNGVSEALVIVGSDKRGTLYGMFHISEMMGVSPWVWWSDVTPTIQSNVVLPGEECNVVSKEPSIKYRGIFLNDEAPSLTTWTDKRYRGRNQYFYAQVYELLLRLKANYLWPAMWGDIFSEGGSGDKLANARLADQYGIVMGTSHHEPLYRAGNEWGRYYRNDLRYTSAQAWNLYNIPGQQGYVREVNQRIEEFWSSGVSRNKAFDNICTVGMRGENDSTLPAADNPPKYAELLNYIIQTQKNILAKQNDKNPTQIVIYKEVEDAWYAGQLYNKASMKDTYAMFCDDNWAYIRTLPTLDQQKTVAGLGMYYHFDYVGAPKSYTWVQNTQISTIWDQMSISYDYGIDDVWIANVGDLKPMELDISYFLDLAYDYEHLGVEGQDRLEDYKKNWARQQFSKKDGSGLTDEECDEAASLIERYLDLESKRVVEHVLYNTANTCSDMYSVDNYREALNILEECEDIMSRTEALFKKVPNDLKSAFYQLVYYPAMAVPNVLRIQIYAALNNKFAGLGFTIANKYAQLCKDAIALDNQLFNNYNNNMPGNIESGKKWQAWDRDSGKLPSLRNVNSNNSNGMHVMVESITNSFKSSVTNGEAKLPTFYYVSDETYEVKLLTKGSSYNFQATADADWINISTSKNGEAKKNLSGSVNPDQSIFNYNVSPTTVNGTVKITSGNTTIRVSVQAKVDNFGDLSRTYIMNNGYATIDVANYSKLVEGKGKTNAGNVVTNKMIIIPDNGKYRTALRTSSSTITYESASDLANAPYAEYKIYVPENGTYNLQSQFNPTSNLTYGKVRLRYGISIDGGSISIINSIVNNYLAGTWKQGTWSADIENHSRSSVKSNISLSKGVHTIRYYQCDPNLALIRMTLYKGNLATVYGSPEESGFVN
ncbi:glycoside hydrolase family 115 protein [Piromyces sp. E2]|nr:glycoside hydrolase family 115 protein [Piromyces sp. E2]|eukprot:OUM68934.1 glycoside hydrolase family 115 protein [Piromyces sp. E2]